MSSQKDQKGRMDAEMYNMSYDTGCVLKNPLEELPPYFEIWNELASSLPTLVQEKRLREEISKMPLLDHTKLDGYLQQRLAHLQLSYITAGYVWQDGENGVPKVLPQCLAVPYYKISEQLDIQPILSHPDLALANFTRIDPNGPYDCDNLKCLYHLPGGKPSDWFYIVTCMVELDFAKSLKPMFRITDLLESLQFLEKNDHLFNAGVQEICQCLSEISEVLKTMQRSLARMHEHLGFKDFFTIVRPFLAGWGGEENPLPDGLIYEGISEIPIKMIGASAAQSTTLQVFDAFLAVEHTEEKKDFLLQMRSFMPPDHRHLVTDLEQRSFKLLDLVKSSKTPALESAYDHCLSALAEFRNYHMQIVKKYIIIPVKQLKKGTESSDIKGTGGTSLIPFLKTLLTDTERRMLSPFRKTAQSSRTINGHGSWTKTSYMLAGAVVISVALLVRRVVLKS